MSPARLPAWSSAFDRTAPTLDARPNCIEALARQREPPLGTRKIIAVAACARSRTTLCPRVGLLGRPARPQRGTPYAMRRRFLQSPSDLPWGAPPWGALTAVDVVKGTIRWRIPFGSMNDFGGAHGSGPLGSISLGVPITTAGGLVFIAGTPDLAYPGIQCRDRGRTLECGIARCRKRNPDDVMTENGLFASDSGRIAKISQDSSGGWMTVGFRPERHDVGHGSRRV